MPDMVGGLYTACWGEHIKPAVRCGVKAVGGNNLGLLGSATDVGRVE